MKTSLIIGSVLFLSIALFADAASADTLFKNALKQKYEFQTVSCNTCHASGKGPGGKPIGKDVRNEFGKLFEPALAGKNVPGRLKEIKDLDKDDKAKKRELQESLTKDFLEALSGVEAMKAADGRTYEAKLKARDVEGVK